MCGLLISSRTMEEEPGTPEFEAVDIEAINAAFRPNVRRIRWRNFLSTLEEIKLDPHLAGSQISAIASRCLEDFVGELDRIIARLNEETNRTGMPGFSTTATAIQTVIIDGISPERSILQLP